jgi:uncharacterized protein involved in exopolysaccharide biosynthesis
MSRPSVPVVVSELRPAEARGHFGLTIFKWYPLILVFGLVLLVAATTAMLLRPVLPSATARILVKTGPEALPIAGLPVASGPANQEFLQTQAALFASRLVLLPVARTLRLERGEPDDPGELDSEVSALGGDLGVTMVPQTTMMQARISAPTEAEAERLLDMIIASYVEQHATAYSGSTTFSTFFEREAGAAATKLQEAEDRLHRWREANNVTAVDEELIARIAAVSEFEGSFRRTEVEIEATRAQLDALTRDVARLPRESVTSREQIPNPLVAKLKTDIAIEEAALRDGSRNPVTERLRMDIAVAEVATREAAANPLVAKLKGELVTAELALNDLRQRYHDEDRRVQEKLEQTHRIQQEIATAEREAVSTAAARVENLRRELVTAERDVQAAAKARIAGLQGQLAAAERERDVVGRETVSPHPLRETVSRDLVAARAKLTTLTSQRDGLRTQIDEARASLARLRDKRTDADRLAREVELAREVYLQNSKRLDDARLTAGLRKHQLTNVAVIEPPRATPATRSLKQVALVGLLGGLVGIALGVATALALDFFNWSLRTTEDVEFYLGVPAVATVPAMPASPRRPRALPIREERQMKSDTHNGRG